MSDEPIRLLLVEDEESDYLVTQALAEQLRRPRVELASTASSLPAGPAREPLPYANLAPYDTNAP